MKRALYFILLIGSLLAGIASVVIPAANMFTNAFSSIDLNPESGEFPSTHSCPEGETPIEVREAFRDTFGGTTSVGTRSTYYCEDAQGTRTDVTAQVGLDMTLGENFFSNLGTATLLPMLFFGIFTLLLVYGIIATMNNSLRSRPTMYPVNTWQSSMPLQSFQQTPSSQVFPLDEAPSPPKQTVAERLKQLDELLAVGLITQEEYDQQRTAILDSLSQ